ncbi:MAG: hypothetical protein PWQ06_2498 [Anaerophaga sp.]|jgi:hypothetical protein|nr:hypothetical protein [Anaerophaga sp.]
MAIKRFVDASNDESFVGGTQTPQQTNHQTLSSFKSGTGDERDVQSLYQQEAESETSDKIDIGTMLPKDLTIKLVRADTANWETFLSCLYSISLTLFGLFLGVIISRAGTQSKTSLLEIIATAFLGIFSFILIGVWVGIKIRCQKGGVRIPHDVLKTFTSK